MKTKIAIRATTIATHVNQTTSLWTVTRATMTNVCWTELILVNMG